MGLAETELTGFSMNPKAHRLLLRSGLTWWTACAFATLLHAQNGPADRMSVSLRDPSRPATVKASHKSGGGITVKGYAGNEVVVEARLRNRKASPADQTGEPSGQLKVIETGATRLTVEEENHVVTISAGPSDHPIDLTIQVPLKTSLKLVCLADGVIVVESVEGEIEASNLSGPVTLTNVAGVVVADSLDGKLLVQLTKVTPDKPMSFSTLTGDIDVTLPAGIKANVRLQVQHGRIESDFDLVLTPRIPTVGDRTGADEKFRAFFDTGVVGRLNGGGAEMSFKTVTGNLQIRKGAE